MFNGGGGEGGKEGGGKLGEVDKKGTEEIIIEEPATQAVKENVEIAGKEEDRETEEPKTNSLAEEERARELELAMARLLSVAGYQSTAADIGGKSGLVLVLVLTAEC